MREAKRIRRNIVNIPTSSTQANAETPSYIKHPADIVSALNYKDQRHKDAMINVVTCKTNNPDSSLLSVMKGRGYVKRAYRILDNAAMDYDAFYSGIINQTKNSLVGMDRVIVPQDTTHINLAGHTKTEGLGLQSEKTLGGLLHSAIAFTTEGEAIGLLHQKFTTRIATEGTIFQLMDAEKSIESKESFRWIDTVRSVMSNLPEGVTPVIVSDRECDIYEAFHEGIISGSEFIFRLSQNRKTTDATGLMDKVLRSPSIGVMTTEICHNSRTGQPNRIMELDIKACSITILKPQKCTTIDAPATLTINVVAATEINPIDQKKPAQWILGTNLPINTHSDLETIIKYYSLRWRIETFHYVLKSGLKIEKIQQRKFELYKPLIYIFSIIACYVMQITYVARYNPTLSCENYFEEIEWKILYRLATRNKKAPSKPPNMQEAVQYLSIIGGGKRSKSDEVPGVKTVWQGLKELSTVVNALGVLNLWNYI